ncbi:hypothetical protein LPJ63_005198 [Coemansia sp. RSA 2711]|nr:hypothetical protein LPJ63_005198 [Coemansia sp. RSA 2711]KAJ1843831.1 hypothetical protein LPJ70_003227 [Coemansia sp. RSA 2708]KAJ2370559.1 hypothetical protein H4S01_000261 [Coemansia sp. RSA 2610]
MLEAAQRQPGGKYAARTSSGERVSWTEIGGGLAVLGLLLAGLAFVALAFMLATIGIGQLELRTVVLLKNWWVSGPLLAAVVALVLLRRHLLWLQFKAASASGRGAQ